MFQGALKDLVVGVWPSLEFFDFDGMSVFCDGLSERREGEFSI